MDAPGHNFLPIKAVVVTEKARAACGRKLFWPRIRGMKRWIILDYTSELKMKIPCGISQQSILSTAILLSIEIKKTERLKSEK